MLVQGQGSAEQIAAAVRGFSAMAPDGAVPRPDLVIVGKGPLEADLRALLASLAKDLEPGAGKDLEPGAGGAARGEARTARGRR